jgi:hypothetical protein
MILLKLLGERRSLGSHASYPTVRVSVGRDQGDARVPGAGPIIGCQSRHYSLQRIVIHHPIDFDQRAAKQCDLDQVEACQPGWRVRHELRIATRI